MTLRLLRLLRVLISWLPSWMGYALAGLVGNASYRYAKTSRICCEANMRHVLGPQVSERRLQRTVRAVFHNNVRNYYELARLPRLPIDEIMRKATIRDEQWDAILTPVRQGKGVIIASAHFGSFEMVSQTLIAKSLEVTFLIAHFSPQVVSEFVTNLRASQGLRLMETGPTTLLNAARELKAGRIVGILADRNLEQHGVELPFFGDPAIIPTGPARLALQTGAIIVPCFCVRLSNERYSVEVDEPIVPVRTGDSEADAAAIMAKVVASYERHIGAHPAQWVLFMPVWKADQHLTPDKKEQDG
ncbi:MAG: hypothetical protein DLM69_08750 [Candidatus Chloroheliales bacterium]|nr:MAG: hypothetical protein DLM69_08750 [Chloroflexota bacterium]